MAPERRRSTNRGDRGALPSPEFAWPTFGISVLLFALLAVTGVPTASAHGGTGALGLSQWHGILVAAAGVVLLGGAVVYRRTYRLSPTTALYGVFLGLVVATLGTIVFEGLSPDPVYAASSMPFERSLYPLLSLSVGLLVTVGSLAIGWLRWPTRPRYAILGTVMGLWIAYPALVPASHSHPLGYALVLGTPVLVGYVLWRDAWSVLHTVLGDPAARRFGIGVGLLVGLFFLSVSGYISFFWEEGAPEETTVAVLPVVYQLVAWPTLEVALPAVPLFLAVSVGVVGVVGLLSVLVGLNAALVARQWRIEEQAGMAGSTAGTATIVGSCTCGCCGPLVAKIAVLAAGPSIAAPLYWVFVDSASPLGSLFVIGSIVLFTASLVYSVGATRDPGRSTAVVPAD
jgi:hypothetical protein